MGPKQSSPAAGGRVRAYSGSDVPSSTSTGNVTGRTAAFRYHGGTSGNQHIGPRARYTGNRPNSLHQATLIPNSSGTHGRTDDTDGESEQSNDGPRLFFGSLPAHLSPHLLGAGFHCPVCSKFVSSDEIDLHLVMCLTKPRLSYNEDVLATDSVECSICLDEMVQGDTIARLPCLCIYHKGCIDEWFEVNRSCPEHPSD